MTSPLQSRIVALFVPTFPRFLFARFPRAHRHRGYAATRPWSRRARLSTAAVYSTELQEISGIEGDGAVLRAPVQVWSRHASRRAHAADELAALDGITGGDQRATQMMVDGH